METQLPKDEQIVPAIGTVPTIRSGQPMVTSRLGVWYLVCPDLAAAVNDSFDRIDSIENGVSCGDIKGTITFRGGRKNINLLGPRVKESTLGEKASFAAVQTLRKCTSTTSHEVSSLLEAWLKLEKGTIQQAHKNGASTAIRMHAYPPQTAVLPHFDASGYTLVFSNGNNGMLVQDPADQKKWWRLESPGEDMCLLLLGAHLAEQVRDRLVELGEPDGEKFRSPIHSVQSSTIPRKAVTIHVKADHAWPDLASEEKVPRSFPRSSSELFEHQLTWDAEHFSKYLLEKWVPSDDAVRSHWNLLQSLVEGTGDNTCRLPDVVHQGYWQLQIMRYYAFLQLHRRFPKEAAKILPPRVIHHVWVCHQLQPLAYKRDCEALFDGKVLAHRNNAFNLEGCHQFHKLWKRTFGFTWPSWTLLQNEVEEACRIAEMGDVFPQCLQANLTIGLDTLVGLFDGIRRDDPTFIRNLGSQPPTLLDKASQNYARFLLAAAYAETRKLTITPGPINDLVWHTHQTDPVTYNACMNEMPTFVNHMPCGKLFPPPEECNWIEMTENIWMELYGAGVDVSGHGLYCSQATEQPKPKRPLGLYEQAGRTSSGEEQEVIYNWWFSKPPQHLDDTCTMFSYTGGLQGGFAIMPNDFPVSTEAIQQMFSSQNSMLQEKSSVMRRFRDDLKKLDNSSPPSTLQCIDCVIWLLSLGCTVYIFERRAKVAYEKRKERYQVLVASYSIELKKHGMNVSLLWDCVGPANSSTSPQSFVGPSLMFRPTAGTYYNSSIWRPVKIRSSTCPSSSGF